MYKPWDSTLNPAYYLHSLNKELVSFFRDERSYDFELVNFLKKNATLLEASETIEIPKNKSADFQFFSGDGENHYLFKLHLGDSTDQIYNKIENILVKCLVCEENKINISFFYPTGSPFDPKMFEKWLSPTKEARISVLVSRHGRISTQRIEIDSPKIHDFELNYGTGFEEKRKKIINKLNDNIPGIFIFHGEPGTGKSTFIKYLINAVDREFIFIPVGLVSEIASPDFISILLSRKNAVLILEDAEKAVQSRALLQSNDDAVSTLLNISDGLLSSILNISIIVTYNADKNSIDKAVMRKGRLLFDYKFDLLNREDANKLIKHLDKKYETNEPMALCDIYGLDEDINYVAPQEKKMGFGFVNPKE